MKRWIFALMVLVGPVGLTGQTAHHGPTGWTRLLAESGGSLPDGAGFTVGQGEAIRTVNGDDYRPNVGDARFAGKSFSFVPSTGTVSGHATTVGALYYGLTGSYTPGVGAVRGYEANAWLGSGFMRLGTTSVPVNAGEAGQNHSWIGSLGDTVSVAEELYRRLDYVVVTQDLFVAAGMNNGTSTTLPQLLGQGYNLITVGRSDGGHSAGETTVEGSGRIKPDLVAPAGTTSEATPMVGAAGLFLRAAAQAEPGWGLAADVRGLKALLMASGSKHPFPSWEQTATRPLDVRRGAGELNVFNAHRLLAGGRREASVTTVHPARGWDVTTTASGGRWYLFEVPEGNAKSRFSAALSWHREISTALTGPVLNRTRTWTPTLANLNLRLHAMDGTVSVGVVAESASEVDNVEHLYWPELPPGRYGLEVVSATVGVAYGLAWHTVSTVEVAGPGAVVATAGDGLSFTLTRAGDLGEGLTVFYTVGGTVNAGVAFLPGPTGEARFEVGEAETVVTLTLTEQAVPNATVTLALSGGDFAYAAGEEAGATGSYHASGFDRWIGGFFEPTAWNDPEVTGPTADPDGDGVENLLEYALGGDPTEASRAAWPEVVLDGDGYLALSYRHPVDRGELEYRVEWAADLTAGFGAEPGQLEEVGREPDPEEPGVERVTVRSATPVGEAARQFLRLRVSRL